MQVYLNLVDFYQEWKSNNVERGNEPVELLTCQEYHIVLDNFIKKES